MDIPVVIPHFDTKPNYLKVALQSAANYNKTVVLIGDASNKDFWNNHWDVDSSKLEKFQEFLKYYVYMSDVPRKIDIAYYKRMFAMEAWMKEEGHDRAFHLDSDVVTFANYTKEVCPVLPQDCFATLMTMEGQEENFLWSSSLHFSYWTLEALEDFTDYCINAYRDQPIRKKLEEKWKWHVHNQKGGGICDMTVLYFWAKDNPRVINFTKVWNDRTADYNFNLKGQYYIDEYEMQSGLKKFIFKDGFPYGFNKRLNQWVRFLCIHCQGAGKCTMAFLSDKHLRRFYSQRWTFHRLKSKYLRFSYRKLKKRMARK